MTWWQAIILGVVEGVTEYLPVSSTGHLLVVQAMLGIGVESEEAKRAADAYAICIQAGAIVAVLGLYWRRMRQVSVGWMGRIGLGKGDAEGFCIGRNIVVAFLPAVIFGLLLDGWITERLFGPWPVVVAWAVGGVAILGVAGWKKRKSQASGDDPISGGMALGDMTMRAALIVGLIQCLAMWPGTSRSLVTIVGGVLIGLSLVAAVEFSFLLGVLTLLAATVHKSLDEGPVMIAAYGWGPMIAGSLAAWVSAMAAVTWMVAYLKKHGMEIFGYYRIAIAVVVGGLLVYEVI